MPMKRLCRNLTSPQYNSFYHFLNTAPSEEISHINLTELTLVVIFIFRRLTIRGKVIIVVRMQANIPECMSKLDGLLPS